MIASSPGDGSTCLQRNMSLSSNGSKSYMIREERISSTTQIDPWFAKEISKSLKKSPK